jgi:hypothetical protein
MTMDAPRTTFVPADHGKMCRGCNRKTLLLHLERESNYKIESRVRIRCCERTTIIDILILRLAPTSEKRVSLRSFGSKLDSMIRLGVSTLLVLALWAATAVTSSAQTTAALPPQQPTQRLILKDGSFQPVVKYEIQGDRVHYFSAERYEWEDIPSSLIDWEATKKYEADFSSGKLRVHVETPEEREEREKEEANSPEISPGLRLPGTGGVFLLDQFDGKPELSEILQNGSEMNQNANKKSVLRTAINPIGSSKHSFELKGPHANIQSHVPSPVIYVDIDEGALNDVPLMGRFRIVRAEVKKDGRVIGNLKVTFTGKTSQESNFVPANVEKVGTGEWIKVTPAQDLLPGEYAVVEMLGPEEMNLYVWDFGVNRQAPANPNIWRPAPVATSTAPN